MIIHYNFTFSKDSNKLELSTPKREVFLTLVFEYGEAGDGSASP